MFFFKDFEKILGFVVIGPVHYLLDGFNLTIGESALGEIVTSLIKKSFSIINQQNHQIILC